MSHHSSFRRIAVLQLRRTFWFVAGATAALTVCAIAGATSFTITAGTTDTVAKTLTSGDTGAVAAAGTLSVSGGTTAVSLNGTSTLSVDGTIQQTGSGRALRTNTDPATVIVTISATGLVQAVGDDAFQARGGPVQLTNLGTLYSGPNLSAGPAGPLATGRGLNLRDASGGTIVNGTTGLIRADGADAVRVGSNVAFTNLGTILGNGKVNDSPANNIFNGPPSDSVAETFSASDGFSFEDRDDPAPGATNSSLINHGTISGARHGVEGGSKGTNLTVTNAAGGVLIGRNGSGVGIDATGVAPGNITVTNAGLIRGDYAGVGSSIDRTGNPSLTHDGDGDGVDIDGAATIRNLAGGQIIGNGAGGFDSGGRANSSDGISLGGGVIINDGLIRGADVGIVVNNDTSADRSGVAATTITNGAAGVIAGVNGYAIRLENKLGDDRDNDVLVNHGTIQGAGGAPDPSGIIVRQDGLADSNSTGTLDGTVYTGTGAARFIKGDGSAVQLGEGDDRLVNSGTISGANGRAVNLEGGNDTAEITGGAINGMINGGTGFDTLTFDLGSPAVTFVQNGAIVGFEKVAVNSGRTALTGSLDLGAAGNSLAVAAAAGLTLDGSMLTMATGSILADGLLHFAFDSPVNLGGLSFAPENSGGLVLGTMSTLELAFGFDPLHGQEFTLVAFGGGGGFLSGNFAGLAEGALFTRGGQDFRITYAGHGAHDIVIRSVPDGGPLVASFAGGLVLLSFLRRRWLRL